jgi:hypothetical protein
MSFPSGTPSILIKLNLIPNPISILGISIVPP